jgi:hypothetical protein
MTFERVYMIWDFYDGVRSGLAAFRGAPHYFVCEFDSLRDGYTDIYRLWPIDEELLALAAEQWQLFREWERRFHSGEATVQTHPALRGQNVRYGELQDEIDRRLPIRGVPTHRAVGKFRACGEQPSLPRGCLRELEVEWLAVA